MFSANDTTSLDANDSKENKALLAAQVYLMVAEKNHWIADCMALSFFERTYIEFCVEVFSLSTLLLLMNGLLILTAYTNPKIFIVWMLDDVLRNAQRRLELLHFLQDLGFWHKGWLHNIKFIQLEWLHSFMLFSIYFIIWCFACMLELYCTLNYEIVHSLGIIFLLIELIKRIFVLCNMFLENDFAFATLITVKIIAQCFE